MAASPSSSVLDVLVATLGATTDAATLLAEDGASLFANDAARAREGALPAEAAADLHAARAAAFEGRATSFQWGEAGPSGVRAWCTTTVSPVREGGVVVAALVLTKDITDLKRSEERLRRSEKLLVDTQGVAHLGTWEWDVSEPNATWSNELYRIYGLTPETYTPSYEAYLTKIHPDDRQRVMDATNRVFHENVPYSHDERIFRPDGSLRYLHTWAFPVLDENGKLTKLVGVCQDITDRKAAEEEVRQLNEGLEKRVAERTRTIEQSMKDLETFHAMVSHDLRAPLSVIAGSAALLESDRGHLPANATRSVERIQRAATQMTRLVEDLLTLAQVGHTRLEPAEVDLTALAEEVVGHLRSSVPSKVTVHVQPGLTCRADPALVRTVLENLVGNAWKYTSRVESPRIEVGAEQVDGESVFHVKDNGVGFDMSDAERLFAPFERLHKDEYKGTGVGLAAVRRIIERHGGRIWAKGSPGEGAVFSFTLG